MSENTKRKGIPATTVAWDFDEWKMWRGELGPNVAEELREK